LLDVAAGLATKIEQSTGLKAVLKEGHAGILEITFNDKVVYSNQSKVTMNGTPEGIIRQLREILSSII
jgi:hypothetical protein